jgi:hypothetical protein
LTLKNKGPRFRAVQKQIVLSFSLLISTFSYPAFCNFEPSSLKEFNQVENRLIEVTQKYTEGLKVFSWSLENTSPESLNEIDSFLEYLTHKTEIIPDILILQDLKQNTLSSKTIESLKEIYPYAEFFPYQKKQIDEVNLLSKLKTEIRKNGYSEEYLDTEINKFIKIMSMLKKSGAHSEMAIFSKVPHFYLSRKEDLDWQNPHLKNDLAIHSFKKSYQPHYELMDPWVRPYLKFNFPWKNKTIHFVPLSLLMPWTTEKSDASILSLLFKKTSITKEITLNEENPHFAQVHDLIKKLDQDDLIKGDKDTLMIGNLNVYLKQNNSWTLRPESLAWVYLENFKFQNLFPLDSKLVTYPMSESKWTKDLSKSQVDHAFTKGQLVKRAAEVLPVKGSSHYPIYVIVE